MWKLNSIQYPLTNGANDEPLFDLTAIIKKCEVFPLRKLKKADGRWMKNDNGALAKIECNTRASQKLSAM
jgi:hypothetical protein